MGRYIWKEGNMQSVDEHRRCSVFLPKSRQLVNDRADKVGGFDSLRAFLRHDYLCVCESVAGHAALHFNDGASLLRCLRVVDFEVMMWLKIDYNPIWRNTPRLDKVWRAGRKRSSAFPLAFPSQRRRQIHFCFVFTTRSGKARKFFLSSFMITHTVHVCARVCVCADEAVLRSDALVYAHIRNTSSTVRALIREGKTSMRIWCVRTNILLVMPRCRHPAKGTAQTLTQMQSTGCKCCDGLGGLRGPAPLSYFGTEQTKN